MGKRVKNKLAVLLAAGLALFSGSCGGISGYEGKELTDKAKALHTSLESADITVCDLNTHETVQEISYRFVGDVMQYMYYGKDASTGQEYYEFNNGTELDFITLPDESEWSFKSKGEDGYYNYSKASRHYFADGAKLFSDYSAAVSASSVEQSLYGGKKLTLSYDIEKLRQYEGMSEMTEFSEVFELDEEGYCAEFLTSFTLSDGSSSKYTVYINKRNADEPIERTSIELPTE